ncbi:MAG TPA: hypothetical protein VGF11_00940 [Acidimicrobiales bacterium]
MLTPSVPEGDGLQPAMLESDHLIKGDLMAPSDASHVSIQLDEDHAPETNGRMPVCRRCGFRTEETSNRHAATDGHQAKAGQWLDNQALASRVAKARGVLGS